MIVFFAVGSGIIFLRISFVLVIRCFSHFIALILNKMFSVYELYQLLCRLSKKIAPKERAMVYSSPSIWLPSMFNTFASLIIVGTDTSRLPFS